MSIVDESSRLEAGRQHCGPEPDIRPWCPFGVPVGSATGPLLSAGQPWFVRSAASSASVLEVLSWRFETGG